MGGLRAEKGQWEQPSELGTLRRGTVSPGEKRSDSSCTLEGRSMRVRGRSLEVPKPRAQ